MLQFPLPSTEERVRLKSEQARRFPDLVTLRLPGDGGAIVPLPLVLGNPSGVTEPLEAAASQAWIMLLRAGLGLTKEPGDLAALLATDCVLYPSREELAAAVKRWPDLHKSIVDEVRSKIAMGATAIAAPWAGDPVPPAIAAVLANDPRRVWFHVRPRDGVRYVVALTPAEAAPWRASKKALASADADHWKVIRSLAEKSCAACVVDKDGEWLPFDASEMIARFPGIAVRIAGKLADLAGGGAESELGEL